MDHPGYLRCLPIFFLLLLLPLPFSRGDSGFYTVVIDGNEDTARLLAQKHNMTYIAPIAAMSSAHIFKRQSRHDARSTARLLRLKTDRRVRWAYEEEAQDRVRRFRLTPETKRKILLLVKGIQSRQRRLHATTRNSHFNGQERGRDHWGLPHSSGIPRFLGSLPETFVSRMQTNDYLDLLKSRKLPKAVFDIMDSSVGLGDPLRFNDPMWPDQWELYNVGQTQSHGPKRFDLNVMAAWKRNITGAGVVVSILDDGVDYTHPDLKNNYDPQASFDLDNRYFLDYDPRPNITNGSHFNWHGTMCAGEVAMEANNSICGVGVAYDASIGGIRMLDGVVTDSLEAAALSYNNQHIDVYTCCWGPSDDGIKLSGPKRLASLALQEGAEKGRGGKGSIFVWATGNGGFMGDHCGADGYVGSPYTLAIGSVSAQGLTTFYSESCSALMAVVPTGESFNFRDLGNKMVTTVPGGGCISYFSGTSSAAPLASGIIALALQANPRLTWRDVQYLVASTSKITDPLSRGWQVNGAGYHTHNEYGFGVMDAGLLVQQAMLWKSVGPVRICKATIDMEPQAIQSSGRLELKLKMDGCRDTEHHISSLEHVQVGITLSSRCRGNMGVLLISPFGTISELLAPRFLDNSTEGLKNWIFLAVQMWGEHPEGIWSLQIFDKSGTVPDCHVSSSESRAGTLEAVSVTFRGTNELIRSHELSDFSKMQMFKSGYNVEEVWRQKRVDHTMIEKEFAHENLNKVIAEDIPPLWQHPDKDKQGNVRPGTPEAGMESSNIARKLFDKWKHLRKEVVRLWNYIRSSDPPEEVRKREDRSRELQRSETAAVRGLDEEILRFHLNALHRVNTQENILKEVRKREDRSRELQRSETAAVRGLDEEILHFDLSKLHQVNTQENILKVRELEDHLREHQRNESAAVWDLYE
uniref:furin-like protease kpc-1 isoform X2 n=1 Tax=Myxine glutinosa TaxID=7769 RepID=UPI00358F8360